MQKMLPVVSSAIRHVARKTDPLALATREAFIRAADEQMALSIEIGTPPDAEDKDLAKVEANSLALGQIRELTDAFQTNSAPVIDAVTETRIDRQPMSEVSQDGLAAIGRERNDGERACAAARNRFQSAKSRCDWYEANHVANPAWAPYYDGLDVRVRIVVAFEALMGAGILLSSGAVAAGLETVVPAYGLTTYLNWKVSAYLGRATFRLRVASLRAKFKCAIAVGAAGGTLVLQNVLLGLMRGGLELSLPILLRVVREPTTIAPAINIAALTLTGLGFALVAYISLQSFQKLNRGFTEEYARLRQEREAAKAALDAEYATRVGIIDVTHAASATAADEALENEEDVLADAKEAGRRLDTARRFLCRSVVTIARAMEQMVNTYNQRVVATWGARGPVPEHYCAPAHLDREEIRRTLFDAGEASIVARHIGQLTANLDALHGERGAVKAALADARDRAVGAFSVAAYGPCTLSQSVRS